MKSLLPSEREIQRSILAALRTIGLRVVHIPNGAHLSGDAGQRFRQWGALLGDGAVPGFPDLLVMTRDGRAGFLEVKRAGGKPDERQLACHAAIIADGFPLAVVRSVDDALAAVTAWGFAKARAA
jgi:hypothetical protein